MEDDPVELPGERGSKYPGVLSYPRHADIDLPFDALWVGAVGERDDVGKIIMTQGVAIDLEQRGVTAEHINQRSDGALLLSGETLQKRLELLPLSKDGNGFREKEADVCHDGDAKIICPE